MMSLIQPWTMNAETTKPVTHSSCFDGGVTIKVETETHDEFEIDDLDHIPLKERLKLLLSSKIESGFSDDIQGETKRLKMSPSLPIDVFIKNEEALQGFSVGRSAYNLDDINQHSTGKGKEQSHSIDGQYPMARNDSHSIPEENESSVFRISSSDGAGLSCTVHQYPQKDDNCQEIVSAKTSSFLGFQENGSRCSSQANSTKLEQPVGQEFVPSNTNNMHVSALPTFLDLVKVKLETLDSCLESEYENALGVLSKNNNMVAVKGEVGICEESYEDEIDHMPLQQRMELLIARNAFSLDSSRNLKCLPKTVSSAVESKPLVSEKAKREGFISRRKRKKTATDSVETALEEDAPGLLQVLVDRGITVDEIKLYGDMEEEDPLDILSDEDSFVDLETVISKLFSQRSSFLKFAPLRCTRGSKPSYCLACLLSLIEQTRYLQFRKWPVQWGWCRDLQSFIFVFENHHRIVLERPEYGYATYFFELVGSLPIDWQIKRLVIAMKLTSCSRATLIENKSLFVGEDLTEGEARVLEEYGWTPNSGLGSMLNYSDRVVHDRKNEDVSEWRSKIGKQLMDGLEGGVVTSSQLPKKFMGYKHTKEPTNHVSSLI